MCVKCEVTDIRTVVVAEPAKRGRASWPQEWSQHFKHSLPTPSHPPETVCGGLSEERWKVHLVFFRMATNGDSNRGNRSRRQWGLSQLAEGTTVTSWALKNPKIWLSKSHNWWRQSQTMHFSYDYVLIFTPDVKWPGHCLLPCPLLHLSDNAFDILLRFHSVHSSPTTQDLTNK